VRVLADDRALPVPNHQASLGVIHQPKQDGVNHAMMQAQAVIQLLDASWPKPGYRKQLPFSTCPVASFSREAFIAVP